MNCQACRYYLAPPDAEQGLCARFPPTPVRYPVQVQATPSNPQGVALATEGVFPPVAGKIHWCGEWTAREKPS